MNQYLKLEYTNTCDLGEIPYSSVADLLFLIYLDADVTETFEEYEEEGEEDGFKEFTPTFRRTTKKYKIKTDLLPEHLIDALQRMKLHDSIQLTFKTGQVETIYHVTVETDYPFDDRYAKATITFDIGERVVVGKCCN
jgi:hypothetical protein